MKKFFSFICAFAVVLSASAVSATPTKSLEKGRFATAIVQPKAKKVVVKKSDLRKTVELKQAEKFAPATKTTKVAKAKKAETNVVVSAISSNFYASDNDIYYALYNEDKSKIFCFDIYCAEGEQDVKSGQTYTLADMYSTYCEWVPANDTYNGTAFASASFTKTVAGDGSFTIVATATDVNGDIWNLSYSEAAPAPEIYNLTMAKASLEYTASYSDMSVSMNDSDENYYFYFDILLPIGQTELISGQTYTLADMDAKYTKGINYVKMEYINYVSASFTQTVAQDGSFTVVAQVLDDKGNTWNLSYAQGAPQISEQTLTLNGIAQPGSSYGQLEAANADSTQLVSLLISASSLEGNFTIDDLITVYSLSYVLFDGVEYDIEDAALNVVYDEQKGAYIATGTLKGVNPDDPTDVVIFTINLTCEGDAPGGGIDPVALPDSITGSDFELEISPTSWSLSGASNEGLYLGIMGHSATVAGHYDTSNLDDYYTYVGVYDQSSQSLTYFDLVDADLTVTYENNVIAVKGTFTGSDGTTEKTFAIDVTGTYTEPTERHYQYDEQGAFGAIFPDYEVDDSYLSKNGIIYVEAENEAGQIVGLAFFPQEGQSELTAGEYPINASGDAGTLYASSGLNSNGSLTYSFAGIQGTQGIENVWFIVAGKATIHENGVIELEGLNSYNQPVNARLGEWPEGVDNIQLTEKAKKIILDGELYIILDGKLYDARGAQIR